MAGEKEIRTKIRSVKNLQKITKAMEMVAASKIRKAQDQMEASRPYAQRIRRVVGHLALANPDYKHPYLIEREVKRVGYIIISTDRGMCGGLNVNMFKKVIGEIGQWQEKGVEVQYSLVGSKAVQFFKRLGGKVLGTTTHIGDRPSVNELIGSIKIMLDAYSDGQIDRLFLVNNKFV
ncbi:MAG: FoF1 ATP synthase subunit gamma, partial [Woeseia sp.]